MHYDALTRRFVSIATDTSCWAALGRGARAWFDGVGRVGYPRVFIGTLGLPYTYTLSLGTSYVYCELVTWFTCIVMTASYCMLIYVRGAAGVVTLLTVCVAQSLKSGYMFAR